MATPNQPPSAVEIDPIEWRHRARNQSQLVATQVWSNHEAFELDGPHSESLLLFPGLGEREGTINDILAHCSKLGVPALAPLFNIEQVHATKEDLAAFINDFGPKVTDELQRRGHVPIKTRATGHSMGGGVLGAALSEAPELFGDVGFEEPAGHTNAELRRKYPNDALRELVFLKRFGQIVGYPFYEAPVNKKVVAAKELGYQVMRDTVGTFPPARRFWNKFAIASSVNPIPNVLSHAAAENGVIYVLGGKDPLIRPKELLLSLAMGMQDLTEADQDTARDHLTIVTTRNRHSHKAFRDGQEHLEIVIDHIHPEEHYLKSAA